MQSLDPIDRYFGEHFSKEHALFLGYLLHSTRAGHLCVYIEDGKIFPSMGELDATLIAQAYALPQLPIVVREGSRWYLRRSFEAEQQFEAHVKRLLEHAVDPIAYEGTLVGEQRAAVEHALSHSLTLICGGPGTGKTYTAAELIKAFPGRVQVGAPTGKAAANLRRALPECEVQTLHALLREPLDGALIVIDEGSMIDAEMMARLFAAIPTGARLVLLGDPNQLPPVEAGSLFNDLAEMGCVRLTRCLRAELQEIVDLAEAVLRGEMVEYVPLPDVGSMVALMEHMEGTLLTPLRRGLYGVDHLNRLMHQAHQGEAEAPIMIAKNSVESDLYNGDVGLLRGDRAFFGQRELSCYLLPPFSYAYVLSVHKSQGSEYDEVHLLLPEGSERFGREMLYTAVTRARRKVTIYAADGVLEKVLATKVHRLSHLSVPRRLVEQRSESCANVEDGASNGT